MELKHQERTTMRLSEAIRLGALLGPQTQGTFFRSGDDYMATCALGAAAGAIGAKNYKGLILSWSQWPILHSLVPENELPSDLAMDLYKGPRTLSWIIMVLNDTGRWTRTQIADWVEGFEVRHATEGKARSHFARQEPASLDEPDEGIFELCR